MDWLKIILPLLSAILASLSVYMNEDMHGKKLNMRFWKPSYSTVFYILIIAVFLVSFGVVLQEGEKEMASSFQGVLQPNSAAFFSTNYNKSPYMEIGDSGVAIQWSGPRNQPLFQILNTPLFISNDNGQIELTANLRGRDGSIAVLDKNEWLVNPSQMTRNYNKDTLEVYDKNHDTVLQIRLLKDRIQFQGKFYDEYGNGVAIVGRKSWHGFVIEQTGYVHLKLNSTIEPIFGLRFGDVRRLPEDSSAITIYDINGPLVLGKNPKGNTVFIDAIVHNSLNYS